MRARRLVAVASVAVGLVALSGCRTEPGVAAYVGNYKITEEAVTRIVDELREQAPERAEPPTSAAPGEQQQPEANPLPTRSQVVSTLILGEVCQRQVAEKNYQPQGQIAPEQVAQQLGLDPASAYPQRVAQLYTCLSALPVGTPAAPTEQELTAVVTAGKKAGVIPPEVTVQEAGAQLDGEQLRNALASRKNIAQAVTDYDVTVNPRYRPLEFPLLSFQGNIAAVSVPLGEEGSGAVLDPR